MHIIRSFAVLFSFISLSSFSQMKTIEERVDSLLRLMTLEEKVGQMNQYTNFWNLTGPPPKEGRKKTQYDQLRKGLIGSMLNVIGVEQVRKVQEIAVNETRLGIPLIFGFDIIHGYKTLSPIPLAESCSWDLEAIEQSARIAAVESSAAGINWTFAPMLDISRDARWGRVMEGAGEDTYYGTQVGLARIKGFQGQDLSQSNTIAACAKHFAAYGFAEAGKDYNSVEISPYTLHNVVLPPFQAAVKEGNVRTVMNAFNTINGVPATADKYLQRTLLKEQWDFEGFIVSDWGSIQQITTHGFSKDLKDAAEIAALAGSDMDMESEAYVAHLVGLVREGVVPERIVNEAAARILRVKYELGLMKDPFKYCSEKRQNEQVYNEEHRKSALNIARKSIVLLKNEKQHLPLSVGQNNLALIGALANDSNSPLGSWRIGSDDNSAVTVMQGVQRYTNNFTYEKGVSLKSGKTDFLHHVKVNTTDRSGIEEAVALAKKSELVIVVVGEHGFMSGEGRSRTRIDLPGLQLEMLKAIHQVNTNIVLVLMNGRPLDLSWAEENIPTILECWHLGTEAGNAISDVLFGEYNPSGKLTMSFPRNVGQIPIYYNPLNTGKPLISNTDIVFHSHYSDERNDPLYPFGYGLSYTSFEYTDFEVELQEKNAIKVSVVIKNSGKVKGEEVVQLYIRDPVASLARPVKELKGFKKIMLAPDQSEKVIFVLEEEDLGFYDNSGGFVFERGAFDIMIGKNSRDLEVKRVEIK